VEGKIPRERRGAAFFFADLLARCFVRAMASPRGARRETRDERRRGISLSGNGRLRNNLERSGSGEIFSDPRDSR
jgi:hypothetical protein